MTERLRPGDEIQRINIVHFRREILKTTSGDYERVGPILSQKIGMVGAIFLLEVTLPHPQSRAVRFSNK